MLESPRLQEKYDIERLLGSGSFSLVYRAIEQACDRIVAIKALRRDVYDSSSEQYADSEVCAMGRLWSHPNIVSVHTVEPGDDDYLSFIVMEHVDGGSLKRELQNGALPMKRALAYAYDVCSSLAYAHVRGVIHRDVKPRNVLIGSDRVAKVSDFGVAQVREERHDYASTFAGTRRYMAPEQYGGDNYDHRVDIYAAGLLLWEMVIGRFPFEGDNQDRIRAAKDILPDIPSWVPEDVRGILKQCLEPDPFERFRDMAAMRDALQQTMMASYEGAVTDRLRAGSSDELAYEDLEPLREALRVPRAAAVCIERCAFQTQQLSTREAASVRGVEAAEELCGDLMKHARDDDSREVANALKRMREEGIAPPAVLDLVDSLSRQLSGPSYSPVITMPRPLGSTVAPSDVDDDATALGDAVDDEQTALRMRTQAREHEAGKKWRRARTMYRRSAKTYSHKAATERREGASSKAAKLYQNAGESYALARDTRRSHAEYALAAACWMDRATHYAKTEHWEHAAESHRYAARAYDQAGKKVEAENEYLAAADLLYRRARNAYERHAYEDAESLCRQAVDLASGSARWRLADEVRHLLHAVQKAWS